MFNLRHLQKDYEEHTAEIDWEMKDPQRVKISPVSILLKSEYSSVFPITFKNSLHNFESTWTN